MNLIQQSLQQLFPDKEFNYQAFLSYNRKLGDFNANISLKGKILEIHCNEKWKDIDDEIKMGLIQHLFLRLFKNPRRSKVIEQKKTTTNIELYHHFIKNIPILTPLTKCDRHLASSFHRVNERFFDYQLDMPNLQWGTDSKRKLACYNFHNDTVTVSTIFKDEKEEVIDYLMYHELLHKYHKFTHKNGRSAFHTKEFKRAEQMYPNQKIVELEIDSIIKAKKKIDKKPKRSMWDFLR